MQCDRRTALILATTMLIPSHIARSEAMPAARVIDDLGRDDLVGTAGTRWQMVTDQVMGGVSAAHWSGKWSRGDPRFGCAAR